MIVKLVIGTESQQRSIGYLSYLRLQACSFSLKPKAKHSGKCERHERKNSKCCSIVFSLPFIHEMKQSFRTKASSHKQRELQKHENIIIGTSIFIIRQKQREKKGKKSEFSEANKIIFLFVRFGVL